MMFGSDSIEGAVATLNKTAKFFALTVGLAMVSACGTATTSGVNPLVTVETTQQKIARVAAMTPTPTMPTGTAKYLGQFSATFTTPGPQSIGGGIWTNEVDKVTGSLELDANFGTNTVAVSITNIGSVGTGTFTPIGGTSSTLTRTLTASGTVAGNGTIVGNSMTAAVTGALLLSGQDYNGSAFSGTVTETETLNMQFVGENAAGLYGNTTEIRPGTTEVIEIWALK